MSSKIRIKLGEIELDYEGPEEFLKQELTVLLKAVSELHTAAPPKATPSSPKKHGIAQSTSAIMSCGDHPILLKVREPLVGQQPDRLGADLPPETGPFST